MAASLAEMRRRDDERQLGSGAGGSYADRRRRSKNTDWTWVQRDGVKLRTPAVRLGSVKELVARRRDDERRLVMRGGWARLGWV